MGLECRCRWRQPSEGEHEQQDEGEARSRVNALRTMLAFRRTVWCSSLIVHRHDACASPTSTDTTHRTPTATDTTHCTGAADSERVDRPTQLCPCCCKRRLQTQRCRLSAPARRKRAGQREAVPLATQAATVTAATPNDSSSTASIQRSVAAWADERRRRPIGVGLLQVHAISAPRHRRSAAAHATARG